MTLQEFKAWFEGFTAALPEGAPNDAQWQIVKAKVAETFGLNLAKPEADDYRKVIEPLNEHGWPRVDLAKPELEDDGFKTVEPRPRQYGTFREV